MNVAVTSWIPGLQMAAQITLLVPVFKIQIIDSKVVGLSGKCMKCAESEGP